MPGDLYYGDNLDVLRNHVESASVDLVYLDPPFNSDRAYSLVRKESRTRQEAFVDSWRWDEQAAASFAELTASTAAPAELRAVMSALEAFLGRDHRDVLAYLAMMAVRLLELKRVLRPTGSLYLHCDPTASHYLKLVLDAIFGLGCFRNEVIWRYRRWPTKARRFQRMHDVLLFYTATSDNDHTFSTLYGYEQLAASTLKTFGTRKQRADFSSGRRKPGVEAAETQGPPLSDFWDVEDVEAWGLPLSDAWEVGVIAAIGKERTGYPTQKPEALLERVVRASSAEGQLVLDPFCGGGTTIAVAERLGRRWVGIDSAIRAVDVTRERLDREFTPSVWSGHGEPTSVDQAARLAEAKPDDFRWWAVRRLGGQPPGGDGAEGDGRGIDGELHLLDHGVQRRALICARGGRAPSPDQVSALHTTVDGEGADYGILLTLSEPAEGLRDAARACGTVERSGATEPRMRLVTVRELLADAVALPPGTNVRPRSTLRGRRSSTIADAT